MYSLSFKMFLRRGVAGSSILAIALLVAIVSSTNAVVNYLNFQSETLAGLVVPHGTYLVLGSGSTAMTDSQVPAVLTAKLGSLGYVRNVLPQKMLTANLTKGLGGHTVLVRGVEDVGVFLKTRGAYVEGAVSRNWAEANAGELLAGALSISLGDEIALALDERRIEVRVVGVFRSQTQSDIELVVPMDTAYMLAGKNNTVSFIEFSLKDGVDSRVALDKIVQLLPEGTKIVKVQQMKEFAQQTNTQVVNFLNVWSLAVYAVVAAASYIASTRLIMESSYELAMLTAMGAKKRLTLTLVLAYTAAIALLGSILGVALGIAGTQTASAILRWVQPNIDVSPFLELEQVIKILLLTFTSSIMGSVYPSLKSVRTRYIEQPL
jgi:ABC-type lipoprotein release transport system permease subunit